MANHRDKSLQPSKLDGCVNKHRYKIAKDCFYENFSANEQFCLLHHEDDESFDSNKLNDIIDIIYKYIESTPMKRQYSIDFAKDVRKRLLCLHYNIDRFVKLNKKFPFSSELNNLLIRYVEIEHDILYHPKNFSKEYQKMVEKKILFTLLNMFYDPIAFKKKLVNSPEQASAINSLFILKSLKPEYKKSQSLIESMMIKLLGKLNILEKINDLKKTGSDINFDKLFKVSHVQKMHKYLESRNYNEIDECSNSDDEFVLEAEDIQIIKKEIKVEQNQTADTELMICEQQNIIVDVDSDDEDYNTYQNFDVNTAHGSVSFLKKQLNSSTTSKNTCDKSLLLHFDKVNQFNLGNGSHITISNGKTINSKDLTTIIPWYNKTESGFPKNDSHMIYEDRYYQNFELTKELLLLDSDEHLRVPSKLYDIAESLKKYINGCPKSICYTKTFVKGIRRTLIYLNESMSRLVKGNREFLSSSELLFLLVAYVELEYDVLYDSKNFSRQYEEIVENQILNLLLNILYNPTVNASSKEYIKTAEEDAALNTLYVMRNVRLEYKKAQPLVENIMNKLMIKLNVTEKINELKARNKHFERKQYYTVPELQKICAYMKKRDLCRISDNNSSKIDITEVKPIIKNEEIDIKPDVPYLYHPDKIKPLVIDVDEEDDDCVMVPLQPTTTISRENSLMNFFDSSIAKMEPNRDNSDDLGSNNVCITIDDSDEEENNFEVEKNITDDQRTSNVTEELEEFLLESEDASSDFEIEDENEVLNKFNDEEELAGNDEMVQLVSNNEKNCSTTNDNKKYLDLKETLPESLGNVDNDSCKLVDTPISGKKTETLASELFIRSSTANESNCNVSKTDKCDNILNTECNSILHSNQDICGIASIINVNNNADITFTDDNHMTQYSSEKDLNFPKESIITPNISNTLNLELSHTLNSNYEAVENYSVQELDHFNLVKDIQNTSIGLNEETFSETLTQEADKIVLNTSVTDCEIKNISLEKNKSDKPDLVEKVNILTFEENNATDEQSISDKVDIIVNNSLEVDTVNEATNSITLSEKENCNMIDNELNYLTSESLNLMENKELSSCERDDTNSVMGNNKNEDRSAIENEETSVTANEDSSLTENEDAGVTENEDTTVTSNEDTGVTENEDAGVTENEDTSVTTNEDTSVTANEDTSAIENEINSTNDIKELPCNEETPEEDIVKHDKVTESTTTEKEIDKNQKQLEFENEEQLEFENEESVIATTEISSSLFSEDETQTNEGISREEYISCEPSVNNDMDFGKEVILTEECNNLILVQNDVHTAFENSESIENESVIFEGEHTGTEESIISKDTEFLENDGIGSIIRKQLLEADTKFELFCQTSEPSDISNHKNILDDDEAVCTEISLVLDNVNDELHDSVQPQEEVIKDIQSTVIEHLEIQKVVEVSSEIDEVFEDEISVEENSIFNFQKNNYQNQSIDNKNINTIENSELNELHIKEQNSTIIESAIVCGETAENNVTFNNHNDNLLNMLAQVALEQRKLEDGKEIKSKIVEKKETFVKGKRSSKIKKQKTTSVAFGRVTRSSSLKAKESTDDKIDTCSYIPSNFMNLENLITPPPHRVCDLIIPNAVNNEESVDGSDSDQQNQHYVDTQVNEFLINNSIFDEDTIDDGIEFICHKKRNIDKNSDIQQNQIDYKRLEVEVNNELPHVKNVEVPNFNIRTSDTFTHTNIQNQFNVELLCISNEEIPSETRLNAAVKKTKLKADLKESESFYVESKNNVAEFSCKSMRSKLQQNTKKRNNVQKLNLRSRESTESKLKKPLKIMEKNMDKDDIIIARLDIKTTSDKTFRSNKVHDETEIPIIKDTIAEIIDSIVAEQIHQSCSAVKDSSVSEMKRIENKSKHLYGSFKTKVRKQEILMKNIIEKPVDNKSIKSSNSKVKNSKKVTKDLLNKKTCSVKPKEPSKKEDQRNLETKKHTLVVPIDASLVIPSTSFKANKTNSKIFNHTKGTSKNKLLIKLNSCQTNKLGKRKKIKFVGNRFRNIMLKNRFQNKKDLTIKNRRINKESKSSKKGNHKKDKRFTKNKRLNKYFWKCSSIEQDLNPDTITTTAPFKSSVSVKDGLNFTDLQLTKDKNPVLKCDNLQVSSIIINDDAIIKKTESIIVNSELEKTQLSSDPEMCLDFEEVIEHSKICKTLTTNINEICKPDAVSKNEDKLVLNSETTVLEKKQLEESFSEDNIECTAEKSKEGSNFQHQITPIIENVNSLSASQQLEEIILKDNIKYTAEESKEENDLQHQVTPTDNIKYAAEKSKEDNYLQYQVTSRNENVNSVAVSQESNVTRNKLPVNDLPVMSMLEEEIITKKQKLSVSEEVQNLEYPFSCKIDVVHNKSETLSKKASGKSSKKKIKLKTEQLKKIQSLSSFKISKRKLKGIDSIIENLKSKNFPKIYTEPIEETKAIIETNIKLKSDITVEQTDTKNMPEKICTTTDSEKELLMEVDHIEVNKNTAEKAIVSKNLIEAEDIQVISIPEIDNSKINKEKGEKFSGIDKVSKNFIELVEPVEKNVSEILSEMKVIAVCKKSNEMSKKGKETSLNLNELQLESRKNYIETFSEINEIADTSELIKDNISDNTKSEIININTNEELPKKATSEKLLEMMETFKKSNAEPLSEIADNKNIQDTIKNVSEASKSFTKIIEKSSSEQLFDAAYHKTTDKITTKIDKSFDNVIEPMERNDATILPEITDNKINNELTNEVISESLIESMEASDENNTKVLLETTNISHDKTSVEIMEDVANTSENVIELVENSDKKILPQTPDIDKGKSSIVKLINQANDISGDVALFKNLNTVESNKLEENVEMCKRNELIVECLDIYPASLNKSEEYRIIESEKVGLSKNIIKGTNVVSENKEVKHGKTKEIIKEFVSISGNVDESATNNFIKITNTDDYGKTDLLLVESPQTSIEEVDAVSENVAMEHGKIKKVIEEFDSISKNIDKLATNNLIEMTNTDGYEKTDLLLPGSSQTSIKETNADSENVAVEEHDKTKEVIKEIDSISENIDELPKTNLIKITGDKKAPLLLPETSQTNLNQFRKDDSTKIVVVDNGEVVNKLKRKHQDDIKNSSEKTNLIITNSEENLKNENLKQISIDMEDKSKNSEHLPVNTEKIVIQDVTEDNSLCNKINEQKSRSNESFYVHNLLNIPKDNEYNMEIGKNSTLCHQMIAEEIHSFPKNKTHEVVSDYENFEECPRKKSEKSNKIHNNSTFNNFNQTAVVNEDIQLEENFVSSSLEPLPTNLKSDYSVAKESEYIIEEVTIESSFLCPKIFIPDTIKSNPVQNIPSTEIMEEIVDCRGLLNSKDFQEGILNYSDDMKETINNDCLLEIANKTIVETNKVTPSASLPDSWFSNQSNETVFIFFEGCSDHNYHSASDPLLSADYAATDENDRALNHVKQLPTPELESDNILFMSTPSETNLNQELSTSLNETSVNHSTDFPLLDLIDPLSHESSPPLTQRVSCDNEFQHSLKEEVIEYDDNSKNSDLEFSETDQRNEMSTEKMNELMNSVLTGIQHLNNSGSPSFDASVNSSFNKFELKYPENKSSQDANNLTASTNNDLCEASNDSRFINDSRGELKESPNKFTRNTFAAFGLSNQSNHTESNSVSKTISFDTDYFYLPKVSDTLVNKDETSNKKVIVEHIVPPQLSKCTKIADFSLTSTTNKNEYLSTAVPHSNKASKKSAISRKKSQISITESRPKFTLQLPPKIKKPIDSSDSKQSLYDFLRRKTTRTQVTAPTPKKLEASKKLEVLTTKNNCELKKSATFTKSSDKIDLKQHNNGCHSLEKKVVENVEDTVVLKTGEESKTTQNCNKSVREVTSYLDDLNKLDVQNQKRPQLSIPKQNDMKSIVDSCPQTMNSAIKFNFDQVVSKNDMIDNIKCRKRKQVDYMEKPDCFTRKKNNNSSEKLTYKGNQKKVELEDTHNKNKGKRKLDYYDDSKDTQIKSKMYGEENELCNSPDGASKQIEESSEDLEGAIAKKKKLKMSLSTSNTTDAIFDRLLEEGDVNKVNQNINNYTSRNTISLPTFEQYNTSIQSTDKNAVDLQKSTSNSISIFNSGVPRTSDNKPKKIAIVAPIKSTIKKEPPSVCPRLVYNRSEDYHNMKSHHSHYSNSGRNRHYPYSSRESSRLRHQEGSSRRREYQSDIDRRINDRRYPQPSSRTNKTSEHDWLEKLKHAFPQEFTNKEVSFEYERGNDISRSTHH